MRHKHDGGLGFTGAGVSGWYRWLVSALWITVVLAVTGCGETPVLPAYPLPMTANAPANPQPHGDYRLVVGDVMDIKFFYNPELNDNYMVRPDGKITLPLAGEAKVLGKTPDEVREYLRETYRGIVRHPEVSVMMRKFTTPRVYVGGEVKTPGVQPLDGSITALQAIMQAGGFTHDAQRATVIVLKNTGAARATYRMLDLDPKTERPLVADAVLDPFDIVFVPQKPIAELAQFFKEYFNEIFPIYRNMAISFPFFYTLNPQVVSTPITK